MTGRTRSRPERAPDSAGDGLPGRRPLQIVEGTEVFFAGLFTPFAGEPRNYPVVRFGRIALVTGEPISWEGTKMNLLPHGVRLVRRHQRIAGVPLPRLAAAQRVRALQTGGRHDGPVRDRAARGFRAGRRCDPGERVERGHRRDRAVPPAVRDPLRPGAPGAADEEPGAARVPARLLSPHPPTILTPRRAHEAP